MDSARVMAAQLHTHNTAFRLLLGTVTTTFNVQGSVTPLTNYLTQRKIIHEVKLILESLNIMLEVDEVAMLCSYGAHNIFLPYVESVIRDGTIMLGRECHKFILPIKVSAWNTLRNPPPARPTLSLQTDPMMPKPKTSTPSLPRRFFTRKGTI
jgi:hypothetical protein